MIKMTFLKWLMLVILGLLALAYAVSMSLAAKVTKSIPSTDHYSEGRFLNSSLTQKSGFKQTIRIIKRYIVEEKINTTPSKPLPIKQVSRAQLEVLDDQHLYLIKLGHSSVLLKVYGKYWLVDPVFSERASPFSFFGPRRFHPSPISIDELPEIEKVLISHNHYDHLDKVAIQKLANKTRQFLVPLGVEGDLQRWGVDPQKILSFDWWQEYENDGIFFAFTPTQHFSGRSLSDRNNTLWGSWVVKTATDSLYFSGDSGYFDGFKTIGEKYGPFDLTFIEAGAYSTSWSDIHMLPEDSVKAHVDLRGKTMIPVHNGTFDLAFHTWYDPLDRVYKEALKQQVILSTPIVGEVITVKGAAGHGIWWEGYR